MKCWTASWFPRRSVRAAAFPLALALVVPGCVSRGAHERSLEELRGEVAELEQESRAKDRSIDALEAERDKLLAEIEDLRDARESLQQDVADREQKLRKLGETYDALVEELEAEVAAGVAHIEQITEGMVFRLPQDVLFPAGSAELTPAGRSAVRDLVARIEARDERVEVQGHTDDQAIKGALAQRYPTNWELAGARAASVVRVLEEAGVEPRRLSAVSFGASRPLVSNESPEGRAQNRRIEVRLVPLRPRAPEGAAPGEPAGATPPPEAPTGQAVAPEAPAGEAAAPPEGEPPKVEADDAGSGNAAPNPQDAGPGGAAPE
jgi:chemotaxis protein MotB